MYMMRFLITVGIAFVATGLVTWLMFVGGLDLLDKDASRLTDQSLSGYIGIIIGGAVAFAGSFVAVMLADRALHLTDHQVALAEQANGIAMRQAPEAEAAVLAAQQYARFKSMLLAAVALLRKADRDNAFAAGGNLVILRQVAGEIERGTKELLHSNVPATVIDLADKLDGFYWQIETNLPEKREVQSRDYFEYALSSLFYDLTTLETALSPDAGSAYSSTDRRMVLMRLLHALYSVVQHIDALIIFSHLEQIRERLTEFQAMFVDRSLPVATINQGVWPRDLTRFRIDLLTDTRGNVNRSSSRSLGRYTLNTDDVSGGLVLALHESGLPQTLTRIRHLYARGFDQVFVSVPVHLEKPHVWQSRIDASLCGKKVPIFIITDQPDLRIYELMQYLSRLGGWKRYFPHMVILIDQVDVAIAKRPSLLETMDMDDAMALWLYFRSVDYVLGCITEAASKRSTSNPIPSYDDLEAGISLASREKPRLKNEHEGDRGYRPPGYSSQVKSMIDYVTQKIIGQERISQGKTWDSPPAFADKLLDLCASLLKAASLSTPFAIDRSRILELEEIIPSFENAIGFSELLALVRHLAKPPLIRRPLYQYAPEAGLDAMDIDLEGVVLLGVAYLDSRFKIRRSALVEALAEGGSVHDQFGIQ